MTQALAIEPLRSPFPYFGGKGKVAAEVWRRFGNPQNYVEPFAGSAAVLLARPNEHAWWDRFESLNDADGNVANWFRAIKADPEAVAHHASQPVTEVDLTARHLWLVQHQGDLVTRMFADPDYYDARAAGWWVWGVSAWVGGDWCTGVGPHTGTGEKPISRGGTAPGVYRKIPMMSGAHGGKGIHRPGPVDGDVISLTGEPVPDVTGSTLASLTDTFTALANRLRRVRVATGDWTRVLANTATPPAGHIAGIFLDPPYDPNERRGDLYAVGDRPVNRETSVHEAARTWALERTDHPAFRIAYCSYSTADEDALFLAAGWSAYRWAASGGYGNAAANRARSNKDREIIWFSPTCVAVDDNQPSLFDEFLAAED